jgi:hypothetical protein
MMALYGDGSRTPENSRSGVSAISPLSRPDRALKKALITWFIMATAFNHPASKLAAFLNLLSLSWER